MQTFNTFWLTCLEHFRKELNAQQFNTWIKPLELEGNGQENEAEVIIIAPNRFVLQWVQDNFISRIKNMAEEHFAKEIQFQLKIADPTKVPNLNTKTEKKVIVTRPTNAQQPKQSKTTFSQLYPQFTLENFVTGKANQLARAGAIQVAESPGTAYNPLFIYGGVGLGKTHLIQAIGNLVHRNNEQAKIRYVHAEKYVSDVVNAYQHKSFDQFKLYYHSLDL